MGIGEKIRLPDDVTMGYIIGLYIISQFYYLFYKCN